MKYQPKRFVVEVKRGTSRAAFASPDPVADRFSNAEAMLFGGTTKAEAKVASTPRLKSDASGGRVLRSLVEPPPPVVEEPPAPVRRGRKPGSKNKPKVPMAESATAAGFDAVAERPRRGRKPGSKNKPKVPVATAFTPAAPGHASSLADVMRSYGFADDGTSWQDADAPSPSEPDDAVPVAVVSAGREDGGDVPAVPSRTRLRDRSTILKRYVLDIEPRPGQPGALRARRLARAAR